MRENETLGTRMRALEHSLSELADKAVLTAIEADDTAGAGGARGGEGGEGGEGAQQRLLVREAKEARARLVNAQFDLKVPYLCPI